MREVIVVARKDGRGGIKPFGTYNKAQKGATVLIGDKEYKVSADGRVNIPKKIMNKWGRAGHDGRKRIGIVFSSKQSTSKKGEESNHWKKIACMISTPGMESKDSKTGDFALYDMDDTEVIVDELVPESDEDYHWT